MPKFVKPLNFELGMPDFEFLCPGCGCKHGVYTTPSKFNNTVWSFNGDVNKPTVVPSIKVTHSPHPTAQKLHICHSYIKDGMIQYLADCTHPLANQIISLPEISV